MPVQSISCARCGVAFLPPRPSVKAKYCSRACFVGNGQVALTCRYCSETFSVYRSRVRPFCTMHCLKAHRAALKQPVEARFWRHVATGDGCWLWTGQLDRDGYGTITGRGMKPVKAHRLSWELAHGRSPGKLWVLHSCDTPACVNPAHLRLGTPKDNTADMISRGRSRLKNQ